MNKIKLGAIGMTALVAMLAVTPVFAAADPNIVNAGATLANSINDNVYGVLNGSLLALIGGIFVVFLVISVVMRKSKQAAR
jgi:hypothetical protein